MGESMIYCFGDIHGCYDEMLALLDKIERQDKDARFIFVGDFVDRGPKVWETVEWMMTHITPDGKYQSVQGNHEQMVVQWYLEYCEWKKKKLHFRPAPRPNYDFMDRAKEQNMLDPEKLKPIMDFFLTLPFHKVVEVPGRNGSTVTYDIAHAWYSYEEPEDSAQQYMDNLWRRETTGNWKSDHIIIHGHTPTLTVLYLNKPFSSPGMIVYRKNEINIDGGCVFSGQVAGLPGFLCGICLETLEEFYAPDWEERMTPEFQQEYIAKFRSADNPFRKQMENRLPPKD